MGVPAKKVTAGHDKKFIHKQNHLYVSCISISCISMFLVSPYKKHRDVSKFVKQC